MKKFVLSLTGALLLFAGAVLIINPVATATPPSGGKQLVAQKCTVCHGLGKVEEHQGKVPAAWWVTTVERMIDKGAKLDKEQKRAVIKYLVTGQ